MPTKFGFHAFHVNLYLHEFFEPILFFDPMDYSPCLKGNFGCFKANEKGTNSPKLKKPSPPNLFSMHFLSTSTCMNSLN